jgi:hypothetical protein
MSNYFIKMCLYAVKRGPWQIYVKSEKHRYTLMSPGPARFHVQHQLWYQRKVENTATMAAADWIRDIMGREIVFQSNA